MKITYDIIQENLRVFEEARQKFPIIQKYIDGEVTGHALSTVGFQQFGRFHDYVKHNKSLGFDPIMKEINWRKLKPILLANTTIDRFKVYLRNRTQNDFIDILKKPEVYERLLKGRWLRKPGRRSSGRRSEDRVSSFTSCHIPIINYIIQNEIEIAESNSRNDNIYGLEWYVITKLSLDNTNAREMEVTERLLKSFVGVVEDSKIDFKKLNVEYVSSFINEKIRKLMFIEKGTVIKCLKDYVSGSGAHIIKYLSADKSYTVENYQVRSGYLYVYLVDDRGSMSYYPFSYFEDMAYHRNSILDSLFNDN